MDLLQHVYYILGGLAAFAFFWNRLRKRLSNPNDLPLPPGPRGLPLIGNLFNMPTDKPWLVYGEWAKEYGDMIYFEILNHSFLILESPSRTFDLLEKRSTIYSSRPRLPMLIELMNWGYNMAVLPYGSWWRRHRRQFHEHFHANAIFQYEGIQTREARKFLQRLLTTPHEFVHHIRHTFAATIMDVSYGISVSESGDPYITTIEKAAEGAVEAAVPGAFLVDLIPLLKYVPSWVPGAGFQRKAKIWSAINVEVYQKPWDAVKDNIRRGTAYPSIASKLMEALPDVNDPRRAEEEQLAKDTTAVAYVGGADTTFSTVQSFFQAMVIYPQVQRKAQQELDTVVGSSRLPDFSDKDSLPYVNAIMKETMRWRPVFPMGFVHSSTENDEYDGYFIPKGTIVIGNTWSILHDSKAFSQPDEFQPERYLKDGKLNSDVRGPEVAAFGYGRRICPGRHFSENSLFSMVSMVLAVYDISPPVDAQGNQIKIKPEVIPGLASYPAPFDCIIKPRSEASRALILQEE